MERRIISAARFFFAIAVSTLLFAATIAGAYADGPIKVEYSLEPATVEATRNSQVIIRLYDSGGKAIDDAKVLFSADMKYDSQSALSHSAMTPIRQQAQKESSPGIYSAQVTFSMPGTWNAMAEVEYPGGKWTESFEVEVGEPQPFSGVNWPIVGSAAIALALIIVVPVARRARSKRQQLDDDADEDEAGADG